MCILLFAIFLIYRYYTVDKKSLMIPVIIKDHDLRYELKTILNIKTSLDEIIVKEDNADMIGIFDDGNYIARFELC